MEDHQKLLAEAHAMGLHYTGTDTLELRALLDLARANKGREHPVPCYGLSFDGTDRRCRICSLRNPCADADRKPRVEVTTAKLSPVPCEICASGLLEVELLDLETRELRDYGCSTPGCPGTVSVQYGWETHGATAVRDIGFQPAEDPEVKKTVVKLKVVKPPVAPAEPTPTEPTPAEPTPAESAPPPPPKVRVKTVKPAEKPAAKPAAKKAAPPAQVPRVAQVAQIPAKKKGKVTFFRIVEGTPDCRGFEAPSLTTVVTRITGTRSWSPKKFFGEASANPKPGDRLTKLYRNTMYVVEAC